MGLVDGQQEHPPVADGTAVDVAAPKFLFNIITGLVGQNLVLVLAGVMVDIRLPFGL